MMLLDAGDDPRVESEDGGTALEIARAAGQSDIVDLLRRARGPWPQGTMYFSGLPLPFIRIA